MRVLLTGGYGFAGKHLAQDLVSCGDDVAVTYYPLEKPVENGEFDNKVPLPDIAQSMALDVTDSMAVEHLISLLQPDAIYHLAGVTFVPEGDRDVFRVFDINTRGTINILEALRKHSKHTRLLYVSSSEVYGEPRPGSLPLTEQSELRPISAYGVSKAAADLAAFRYAYREHLHVIRVRPFPHIGPGQRDSFAISSFARQVAEIKLGKTEPKIMVGNLEAKRDYSDVSDMVRGYREALTNGNRGEVYNLSSGTSVGIGEMLQRLIKIAEVEVEVVEDPSRLRPVDIIDMYGSHDKATREFGWKPRIDLEATLHSLFAYWVEFLEK